MKFIVDELLYYEGFCPFVEKCDADVRMGKRLKLEPHCN